MFDLDFKLKGDKNCTSLDDSSILSIKAKSKKEDKIIDNCNIYVAKPWPLCPWKITRTKKLRLIRKLAQQNIEMVNLK